MTFTNDDLKRLKECVHPLTGLKIGLFSVPRTVVDDRIPINGNTQTHKFDLVALLGRLEAAETVIKVYGCEQKDYGSQALKAWCKSKGLADANGGEL